MECPRDIVREGRVDVMPHVKITVSTEVRDGDESLYYVGRSIINAMGPGIRGQCRQAVAKPALILDLQGSVVGCKPVIVDGKNVDIWIAYYGSGIRSFTKQPCRT